MNLCNWPRCGRPVKHPRLMCLEHWAKLPPRLQAMVRLQLTARNVDSARIALRDYFNQEPKDL